MFYATFGYFVLSRGHPHPPQPPFFVFGDFKRGRRAADPLTRVPHLVTTKKQKKEEARARRNHGHRHAQASFCHS